MPADLQEWMREHGSHALHNGATALMVGAAAHAVYLAAVPEPLRVPVAIRNAGLWKRISMSALVVVAVYDGLRSRQLAGQSSALAARSRALKEELLQAE